MKRNIALLALTALVSMFLVGCSANNDVEAPKKVDETKNAAVNKGNAGPAQAQD